MKYIILVLIFFCLAACDRRNYGPPVTVVIVQAERGANWNHPDCTTVRRLDTGQVNWVGRIIGERGDTLVVARSILLAEPPGDVFR